MTTMDLIALWVLLGWLGYWLGRGLLHVNDKTVRESERPLDLTGWRR